MSIKHYHHQHQQVIHHHNASLVQNNYALKVTLKIKAGAQEASSVRNIVNNNVPHLVRGERTRISTEVYFLICQSCFWCASYISKHMLKTNNYTTTMTNCPACLEGTIESLPIAQDEEYKFDYNNERGVILEFLR